jgi:ammonia channel protein AmtB
MIAHSSCHGIGGGPVEIGSGMGGLAFSWVLGRRQEKELQNFRPHNVSLVSLGSAFNITCARLILTGLFA